MQQLHAQFKRCETMLNISTRRNKFAKLNVYKHLNRYNSMRNDRISMIFATLNFSHFIVQFTSLKLHNICDDYQLNNMCNNCMTFEILESRVVVSNNFFIQKKFNDLEFTLINNRKIEFYYI